MLRRKIGVRNLVLIASGLAIAGIGFAEEVVIKIKYPDGSTVVHRVPEGSEIEVVGENASTKNAGGRDSTQMEPLKSVVLEEPNSVPDAAVAPIDRELKRLTYTRFFFGVLEQVGMESLNMLAAELPRNTDRSWKKVDGSPLVAGNRLWLAVRQGVRIPRHDMPPMYEYAVLEEAKEAVIRLDELTRVLSMRQLNATEFEFTLSPKLLSRIKELAVTYPDQRLAVVANGTIIAAPKIASIGERLVVDISRDDARFFLPRKALDQRALKQRALKQTLTKQLEGFWNVAQVWDGGVKDADNDNSRFEFRQGRFMYRGEGPLPRRGTIASENRGFQKFHVDFIHRGHSARCLIWITDMDRALIIIGKKPSELPLEFASTESNGNLLIEIVRDRETENMYKVAQGMMRYEAQVRTFPGSANTHSVRNSKEGASIDTSKSAKPYSWRVAILPFIGHQDLYDRYCFDEPWDSEANLRVANEMPDVYRRPGNKADTQKTHLMGFSGDDTVLGTSQGVGLVGIEDGTSHTVLFVSAAGDVPWTKPEDIAFNVSSEKVPARLLDGDSNLRRLKVALADGSVSTHDAFEWQSFKAFVTRNGHETIRFPR